MDYTKEYSKLLKTILDELTLIKYNYVVSIELLLKKIKEIEFLYTAKNIIPKIEILKNSESHKIENLITEIYNIQFKEKKLGEYIEIFVKDGEVFVNDKSEEMLFNKLLFAYERYKFFKKAITNQQANFCRNLITNYETFYVSLIKLAYRKYPLNYLTNEKIILHELIQTDFEKEKIIDKLISNKCNGLTNNSTKIVDICEILTLDKDIFKYLNEDFEEIYYRRNCVTHSTSMLVSDDYKNHVSQGLQKKYIKENKLVFSHEYCLHAYEIIVKTIFHLFIVTLIKEDTTDDEIEVLTNIIFKNMFMENQWEICKIVYNILRQHKYIQSNANIDDYRINYILCLKKLDEKKEFAKQLSLFNTNNMNNRYKIAKLLLEEKYEEATKLLESTYSGRDILEGKFSCFDIQKWPIFSDFRKTNYFENFKQNHAVDFKFNNLD